MINNIVCKRIVVFVCMMFSLGISVCPCFAYFQNPVGDGGFPGEYLTTFSAGARASGMGGAYTALSADASGPYWNPAGLARAKLREVSFMYVPLFSGSNYYFIGYAYPFGNGSAFAISRIGLDSGEADYVTALGEVIGKFRDCQSAYLISYGAALNPFLDLGMNFKIVTQSMLSYSDIGYGFDVGATFHLFKGMSCGVNIQNLLPPVLMLKDESDVFPFILKCGIAYKLFSDKFVVAADADIFNPYVNKSLPVSVRWKAGMEYRIVDSFAARAGVSYKEIDAGATFSQKYFAIDYACGISPLTISHLIGINVYFGMPLSEEEKIIQQKKKVITQEEQSLIEKKSELKKKEEQSAKIITMLNEARDQFNLRNFKKTEEIINEILKLEPKNKEACSMLGEIEQKKGKVFAEERFMLAKQYFGRKDYEGAEREIREAIKLSPDSKYEELLHHILGSGFMDKKKYKEAYEELIKVLEINPDNKEAKDSALRLKEIMEVMK